MPIITRELKHKLADKLLDAFNRNDRGAAEAVVSEMRGYGLTWCGVYSDGFWVTNIAWLFNPCNQYPFPCYIRCGFSWELFA